ncbi:3-oxoacyl-[acyl-carrier-protein] reductase [Acuticoccus sp. MNP-M23]|uniref:3-oxoacyl-[acyl-carrier-protein] reductase n=1 Tax=Acuticoccus sp. MNP-M23 TaxID=3072793 RepID=UPI002814E32A|nr:3-oxoacyl-[acyl-carrier-protein] reductase [Acuticoccus sp. MNP-M23]WMS41274.1 3-oxoacyl-[acyl-carrier-protein] reductase [Acuticoccus sp. MNP-M23]
MFDLSGKTALVTGATGGIGGAIAASLKGQGANVIVTGSTMERATKAAEAIGATPLAANLADRAAVDALAKDAEAAGPVDILVNCAGVTRDGLMMRMKDEDFDQVLEINLTAAFRLSKAVMRGMMKRRWGRIVNVGSVVGFSGNAGQANYAAAKAGLVGLTKSIAREVASRGITANVVAPGYIATSMTDVLSEDQRAGILTAIPEGSIGTPEDIANAVVYLSSLEARYVTGQTLHVNGGMAMGF